MISQSPDGQNSNFKDESRRHEYDFEREDGAFRLLKQTFHLLSVLPDYRRFQELLMGQDVRLDLQVPVRLVTCKRYDESKPSGLSELQYIRLWQYGRSQYLMVFANASSNKYREYKSQFPDPMVENRSIES